MTVWKAPGIRASASETEEAKRRRRAKAQRANLAHRSGMERARAGWKRGLVRPWYITAALDLRGLDGPAVDEACLVEEPTVDLWEAGEVYPTFEQLCALAKLTDMLPWWFVIEHEYSDAWDTTLRFHVRLDPSRPPVETLRFKTTRSFDARRRHR